MKSVSVTFIVLSILTSCNFSKSVEKDFISGLLTKGDGLSCDDVYLSVNEEKTKQNTFIYGQKFKMNFNNIHGFLKENGNVFPGMQIMVISSTGDTVLQSNDLYEGYKDGLNLSPLLLTASITAASPINSGNAYTLYVNIWDKKEKGTFSGQIDFKVVTNEDIVIDTNKVTFNEIYIFSRERGVVIPDNNIKLNENTYIIIEGVAGFKEEEGLVFPGLSLIAVDNNNNVILDYTDLFVDYSENGLSVSDLYSRISANFNLNMSEIKNPLHCELKIWDKKSDARLTAKIDLIAE